jgi:HAD superfamily hydrolase (TIGR01509 family)
LKERVVKNVIFDVGGVLLEWNPRRFLERMELPSHFTEVFESLLWAMHDGGLLSREELLEKLPAQVEREVFAHCIQNIARQLKPIPEMIELFHGLRRRGYKVYILSNMPEEMHAELIQLHDFFSYPEGQIFSYQVKAIKPQPQIYEALLKRYKLYPEESVFIDDRWDNLVAAERLKIRIVQCQSPPQVLADLKKMGVEGFVQS